GRSAPRRRGCRPPLPARLPAALAGRRRRRRLVPSVGSRIDSPLDLFDHTVESITALEVLIGTLPESASPADLDKGFSLGMGAYVGEVIVRHGTDAHWT
ncbi:hypothetical protein ACFWEJ_23675, partial [Promicromonospora sp. NPDC060204]|uniref:hypothetical protein n=1 Tax=Promicromonospora sp. NPDC060204 TaxID=3347071 RepID=UPI00364CE496